MPYIDVIEPDQAEGKLKEIYEELANKRGKIAEVHKIQSLNPKSIVKHMDLYMTVMFGKSPLSRAQREMVAIVVSAANNCDYCQLHHTEALLHYWKDEKKVNRLRKNHRELQLDEKERLYCDFAEQLTLSPAGIQYETVIEPMKKAGVSDREILDLTLVISYFNFVNRMVLGLGVEASEEEIKGYKY